MKNICIYVLHLVLMVDTYVYMYIRWIHAVVPEAGAPMSKGSRGHQRFGTAAGCGSVPTLGGGISAECYMDDDSFEALLVCSYRICTSGVLVRARAQVPSAKTRRASVCEPGSHHQDERGIASTGEVTTRGGDCLPFDCTPQ